jgi:RNA recognition motif-containing protein
MDIYIGNIPQKFAAFDLRKLFYSALQSRGLKGLFSKNETLANHMKFTIVEEEKEDGITRYGLATVDDDNVALHCIEKLNNKIVGGRPLVVREFSTRTCMNERRSLQWRGGSWAGKDQRGKDRRKKVIRKREL